MRITRRHVLAAGAAVAAASAVGVGGLGLRWWDQPPEAPYARLSAEEGLVVSALAEALYPPGGEPALSGAEAQLDRFIDEVLTHMPEFQAKGIRLLVHALEALGGGFSEKPLAARRALVHEWMVHPIAEVRSVIQSLVLLLGMGYTIHPEAVDFFSAMTRCGYGV
ncbi:MAG TPA: hypothetical protein QGF58_02685 [Myxococcota bacterium]|nr:hypothetical protein [Myxococcota bacterium]